MISIEATGRDPGSQGERFVCLSRLGGGVRSLEASRKAVTAVPASKMSWHQIPLPKVDDKTRSMMIEQELRFSMPLPLEKLAWGYRYNDVGAEVATVLEKRLNELEGVPSGKKKSAWSPASLCYLRAVLAQGLDNATVLDLGASHTCCCVIAQRRVVSFRSVNEGGDEISKELAKALGLSFEVAETQKKNQGLENKRVGSFLARILGDLKLKENEHSTLLLCGGGAQMPGLYEWLEKHYNLRVSPFPMPSELSPYQHVLAYGAALSGMMGSEKLKYFYHGASGAVQGDSGWSRWLLVGGCAVALLIFNVEYRNWYLSQQNLSYQHVLSEMAKRSDVTIKEEQWDKMSQDLKSQIDTLRETQKYEPQRILSLLSQCYESLPEGPNFALRSIVVEGDDLKFEMSVQNVGDSTTLLDSWSNVLREVEVQKTQEGEKGTYIVTLTARLPEVENG